MALANRTWQQIRTSVGYNLRAYRSVEADGAGTTKTFLTDELSLGGSQEYLGGWLVFTSGTNDGEVRRITKSEINSSTNLQTVTYHPTTAAATSNGDTAEIWEEDYNPEALLDFANQAVMDAYTAVYDPVEDVSLHGGNRQRWDIPSGLSMIKSVMLRKNMDSKEIIGVGSAWDESVDSDFSVEVDDEDVLFGRNAIRFTIGGSVSEGEFASDSISSLDLSRYTHIEFPIKVRTAVAANDLVLRLSATANGADTDKIIGIHALSATTDTWVRVAMNEATSSFDASETTAIISVALEYNDNQRANTVWIGQIVATRNDSYDWMPVKRNLWGIDKESRDLVTTFDPGYYLIKLGGGDEPALFTSDSSTNEIDDQYVVAQTTAMALDSESRPLSDGRLASSQRAQFWYARADLARRRFPFLYGVRRIE